MNVYEISGEIAGLLAAICEQDGEITPEQEARLTALEVTAEQKGENIIRYIRNLELENEALKTEAGRIDTRIDTNLNQIGKLQGLLKVLVGEGNKRAFGIHKVSWRSATSVQVDDEGQLPSWYMRERVYRLPDKKEIEKDLKSGAEVPGARLETKQHLQIK